jgi:hypothetical protein
MGKSALKYVLKRAKVNPVMPKAPADGDVKQPGYARGATAIQTSPRLLHLQSCVAGGLAGKKFGSRMEVQKNFASVAKGCGGKG